MRRLTSLCLLLVLAIACGGVSPGADWPQWRHDAVRSAASPSPLPEKLYLRWVRQLPAPRPAWPASQPSLRFDASYSPVAAAGLLFVPSMVTDTVTAYDMETGREKWRFYADGPVRLAPVADGGRVYFGSDDGFLYCVDAAAGRLVWKFRAAPQDRCVLGNDRLISSWPIRSSPVLHNGKVYCTAGIWCFMGVFAYAVDADTGRAVWTNSGWASDYQAQPHSGAVSFAGFVGRGYSAVVGDRLAVPGGRTPPGYFDLATGKLTGFEWAKSGGRRWNITGDGTSIRAGSQTVAAGDGVVTVGRWKGTFEGDAWNVLAADGKLLVVTTEGHIYCFGGEKGEPKTYAAPPRGDSAVETPPISRTTTALLKLAGDGKGYCVFLGLGTGRLAEEIIRASDLHVIVVDPDAEKIDAFRRRMTDAGLYGTRVSALAGAPVERSLPPYMASLVLSEDVRAAGLERGVSFVKTVFRTLRPYGGTACLPVAADKLRPLVEQAALEGAEVKYAGTSWSMLVRRGPLPGAADWTHNYADAGNSVVSGDKRVKAPLGLLWFGNGPPNDEVLPRHGHGPSPQVAAGRLVIEGPNMLRAIDVYTGRLLWQDSLPGLGAFYNKTGHQPGAGEIGSNYVSLADSVYVAYGRKILRLDAATGRTLATFSLPGDGGQPPVWGYLGAWKDLLVAAATPVEPKAAKPTGPDLFTPVPYSSASRQLVVMDRNSGKVLWTRRAKYNFRHNNIALGGDKVFCIDGLSRAKQDALKRRGLTAGDYAPALLALDVRTGREVWSTTQDVFGTFLGYSAEHDVLLQSGSSHRDRARDESSAGMIAYRGGDGRVLWKDLARQYSGPCLLFLDRIIAQGPAYRLLTGEPATRRNPLSGAPLPWSFTRTYGCNSAIAGQNLITFRSGAAGFYDLARDGGTGNLGGFKSSCTSNLIVADGVLSAPEYTRTCTCNYQNQTSLALVYDPRMEMWTFNSFPWDGRPVRRVGINFGAPGDRRADDGTLWLDYPSRGGASPDIPVEVGPSDVTYRRRHSLFVEADPGELSWVAASAAVGVTNAALTLAEKPAGPRRYTVRLHFADAPAVQPGQRVFDVALQGKKVLTGFDVVKTAGGAGRAVVREFRGVEVTDRLVVALTPAAGSSAPPILSGVEVVAEDW